MTTLLIFLDEVALRAANYGDRALNNKWTPIVLAVLVAFCAGLLLGIELIRAVTS